jgi:hypothetical protein
MNNFHGMQFYSVSGSFFTAFPGFFKTCFLRNIALMQAQQGLLATFPCQGEVPTYWLLTGKGGQSCTRTNAKIITRPNNFSSCFQQTHKSAVSHMTVDGIRSSM